VKLRYLSLVLQEDEVLVLREVDVLVLRVVDDVVACTAMRMANAVKR